MTNSRGLRILDKKDGVVTVSLQDILSEVIGGDRFHWSIIYLQTTGDLGEGKSIPDFEKKIIDSEIGYPLKWMELIQLSERFWDLWDIILIASLYPVNLKRYKSDQEMYETCDVVIEKVDSNYWEVFSTDYSLIKRLATKFKEIKYLETDFEK